MSRFSPAFRRVLAVLLLLLTVLAGHELFVEPLLTAHRRLDAEWHSDGVQLAHYQRVAASLATLTETKEQLQAAAAGPLPYLTGGSESLAVAELQRLVKEVAESSGARLIGTRVLTAVQEDGFERIGLRVTLSAPLPPLQAALYRLEAHLPILFIDDLSIQRHDRDPRAGVLADDPQLDIAFDLLAYRKEPS